MTPTPIGPVWKLSEQMLLLRISIASKEENWRIKDLFGPSPSDSVVCGHGASEGTHGPAAVTCRSHIVCTARTVGNSFTGCPISKFPLCFCHFLGFWSTDRGTSELYSTALEICYILATRIFEFDLEIAEIIEVKVGTRHLEINILAITESKKIILV